MRLFYVSSILLKVEERSNKLVCAADYSLINPSERVLIDLHLTKSQCELLQTHKVLVQPSRSLAGKIIVLYHNLNESGITFKQVLVYNFIPITALNAFTSLFGPRERCEIKKGDIVLELDFIKN